MNICGLLLMVLLPGFAFADQAVIRHAEFEQHGSSWTVSVTLQHTDTGWDHYADGWRVVTADGRILGHRTLYHPHVNEQPFTRSLSGIKISAELNTVFIEAHDKVHGWNKDRLEINLQQAQGEKFQVQR